ncbi:MAG: hypothetical protein L3J03_05210 [Desulfobacterales bacterium]|nr:hypothetical protein [Desulfobacterales bacterium]
MQTQVFLIRSLAVQNLIMGLVATLILFLLIRSIMRRQAAVAAAVIIWALIVLWFFNGPLWGFSGVVAGPAGIRLRYGFLSIMKNTSLPPDTPWKIQVHLGGVKKTTRLYYLQLAGRRSLKVKGPARLDTLRAIGAAIDRLNNHPQGKEAGRKLTRSGTGHRLSAEVRKKWSAGL